MLASRLIRNRFDLRKFLVVSGCRHIRNLRKILVDVVRLASRPIGNGLDFSNLHDPVSASKMLIFTIFGCALLMASLSNTQLVVIGGRHSNFTYADFERELLEPSIVNVQCLPNTMCITLSKNWLQDRWQISDYKRVALIETCDQSKNTNLTHVTLCTEAHQLTTCGTTFTVNDSHVIYSNNVTVKGDVTEPDVLYRRTLPWKCVYPVRLLVGVQFIPQISPVTQFLGEKSSEGIFRAAMFLFKDEQYSSIYEYAPSLQMDDRIRVRVQLVQGPSSAKVQVTRCWATPQPLDSDEALSEYELIQKHCPSPMSYEADVNIVSNGEERHATWESNVFRFVGFPNVYLHCSLRVCFDGPQCAKTCDGGIITSLSRRKRRDVKVDHAVVSLGPLKPGSNVPAVGVTPVLETTTLPNRHKVKDEVYLLGLPRVAVYVIIIVLVVATLAMILASAVCIVRRSKARKQVTLTSSTDDVSGSSVRATSYQGHRSVAMPTG